MNDERSKILTIIFLALASLFVLLKITTVQAMDTIVLEKDNTIVMAENFTDETTSKLKLDLLELLKTKITIPLENFNQQIVYLVMDTPGGSVQAGINMIDFILSQNVEVKTISILSASMGFQTVQGLGERLITPSGTLMAHKASGGFQGEFGSQGSQLDNRLNFWQRRLDRLDKLAVKRTKGKHTLKTYRDLFENEFWCEGQDCVNEGFADRVVKVTCGKSLQGFDTKTETVSFFGSTFSVKYDKPKCPLIGLVNIEVNRDNRYKPLSEFDSNIRKIILNKLYGEKIVQLKGML